jgi:hypothetical protein
MEKTIGRPRRKWEDNIKMHLKEIWCEDVESIQLARNKALVSGQ